MSVGRDPCKTSLLPTLVVESKKKDYFVLKRTLGCTCESKGKVLRKVQHNWQPVTMASVTLGRIEEFDSREEWPQYVAERLEHFFAANSIAEDEKKSLVFLTMIGAATYKVLRDLVSPAKPGTKPLEELLQKLEQYYSPRPSEIVQRFGFHTCFRKPDEAIASFIARLHSLSEHCTFGDSLEDMICDRLVCGISEETIQKHLFAESKLTYKKAVELALGLETADKNVKLLRNNKKRARQY